MRGSLALGDRAYQGGEAEPEGYMAYTFPQPIFPAPHTAQYGHPGRRRYQPIHLPKHKVKYESEVYCNITNKADILEKSFAERYLVGRSGEFWAKIDGWILEFWNPSTFNEKAAKQELIHPAGYIDLRSIRGVEFQRSLEAGIDFNPAFPWEVMLNTRGGIFTFRVRDEWDAWKWSNAIKIAEVDNLRDQEYSKALAKDMSSTKSGVIEQEREGPRGSSTRMVRDDYDSLMHYTLNPDREHQLRSLWKSLVRSTVKGESPDPTIFSGMFELYDFDGNQNLEPDEIEIMLKELYSVRWEELQRALEQQEKICFAPDKMLLNAQASMKEWQSTVGTLGTKLKEQYRYCLQRHGFERRAMALRLELDQSHDGTVNLTEFVRGAPSLLLPIKELQMEGQFYFNCSHAIEKLRKQGEEFDRLVYGDEVSDDSEDEGCIQQ